LRIEGAIWQTVEGVAGGRRFVDGDVQIGPDLAITQLFGEGLLIDNGSSVGIDTTTTQLYDGKVLGVDLPAVGGGVGGVQRDHIVGFHDGLEAGCVLLNLRIAGRRIVVADHRPLLPSSHQPAGHSLFSPFVAGLF
jgi:hypothetical protein